MSMFPPGGQGMTHDDHAPLRRAGILGAIAVAMSAGLLKKASAAVPAQGQSMGDWAEIQNLISGLTFADDRHDGDAFAAYFTPDGVLRIEDPKGPVYQKGREAIRNWIINPAANGQPSAPPPDRPLMRHINFNNFIQIVDRTHARHMGYWLSVKNDSPPRDDDDKKLLGIRGQQVGILGCGVFDDFLVKVSGRWLLQEHRLRFDTANPAVESHP